MVLIRDPRRRVPAGRVALAASAALVASLITPATAIAVTAPVAALVVPASHGDVTDVLLTENALHAITHDGTGVLRTRDLTMSSGAVTASALRTVDTAEAAQMAEHDGVLAYTGPGGRLVLRGPDGTTTTPPWGTHADFTPGGPMSMNATWITAGDGLYHRETGQRYDLLELADVPADVVIGIVVQAEVTGSLMQWQVIQITEGGFVHGVYLAPLTLAGPGAVRTLALVSNETLTPGIEVVGTVGIAGETPVWARHITGDDPYRWLRWLPGGTGSSPSQMMIGATENLVGITGSSVVMAASSSTRTKVRWRDFGDGTGSLTRTFDLPGNVLVRAVHGTLLAYEDDAGLWLVDAAGRPVTVAGGAAGAFPDVPPGHGFHADITWLVEQGITGGYGDGTFRPKALVSRQHMAAFLYRMAGEPEVDTSGPAQFRDIPKDHPFYEPITWLVQEGITGGYGDGTFRPKATVTRQQMAAFLCRYSGQAPLDGATVRFSDVPRSHPFFADVAWLATSGVTGGYGDGTFRPTATVTRQHMAAFLHRFADAGLVPRGER